MASRGKGYRSRKPGKDAHNVKLSKLLSYTLRHGAVKEGLDISDSGCVKVCDILSHSKFRGYTVDDIKQVVVDNDKQRFHIIEDCNILMIRANQGHSMVVPELELSEIEPNELLLAIHGTYEKCIAAIKRDGLSRMGRQHIHMAVSESGESGVISGMRSSCDYIVRVNICKAQEDGLKFYRSSNNVILCEGDANGYILPKYFDFLRPRTT